MMSNLECTLLQACVVTVWMMLTRDDDSLVRRRDLVWIFESELRMGGVACMHNAGAHTPRAVPTS